MRQTIILLACVLAVLACSATPKAQDNAAGEVAMPVYNMSQEECTSIRVEPGQTFVLSFQGRPGTGYSWSFAAEPDRELLEFLGETIEEIEREPERVGGSETFRWAFKALQAGEAEIAMKYVRPWESDAKPAKAHVFRVKIEAAESR